MKFKLDWGKGIIVTYVVFLIIVLGTVAYTTTVDVDLVAENYYEKEISYQNEIDKKNRTNNLTEQLVISLKENHVEFLYPKIFDYKGLGGTINFYRPSDNKLDFNIQVKTDSSFTQIINTDKISKGLWKIKTDWNYQGSEYFNEKIVIIN